MWILRGLLGIAAFTALAWALSENRRRVEAKTVAWGLGLQFGMAVLLLKVPVFQQALVQLNRVVRAVERASHEGGAFVFGYLTGGEAPFSLADGATAAPPLFFFGPLMMLIVVGA